MTDSDLRRKFKDEKGISWRNSHGEPDIDYVEWLEAKVIAAQPDVIKSVCGKCNGIGQAKREDYFVGCVFCNETGEQTVL